MGNKLRRQLRLENHEIVELLRQTDFSRDEIIQWSSNFREMYPRGYIISDDLRQLLSDDYPCGNPDAFTNVLFALFDQDKDGHISFTEFLKGIYILGRRDTKDKATWLFALLDVDNDGFLSSADLRPFVIAAKALIGYETEDPEADVNRLIFRLDKDGDGRVSAADFREFSVLDNVLGNALSLFYLPFEAFEPHAKLAGIPSVPSPSLVQRHQQNVLVLESQSTPASPNWQSRR